MTLCTIRLDGRNERSSEFAVIRTVPQNSLLVDGVCRTGTISCKTGIPDQAKAEVSQDLRTI